MKKQKVKEKADPMRVIQAARNNVAARYVQPYQINAILRGEWDGGYLIKDEVQRIMDTAPQEIEEQDAE